MEPTNLNPARADDARFDAWLKRNATLAPLPDHGFAGRVLHALPARIDPVILAQVRSEQRAEAGRRAWFCVAGAAAGLTVIFAGRDGKATLADLWHRLGTVTISPPDTLLVSGVATLIAGSLALAYRQHLAALRRRLA